MSEVGSSVTNPTQSMLRNVTNYTCACLAEIQQIYSWNLLTKLHKFVEYGSRENFIPSALFKCQVK